MSGSSSASGSRPDIGRPELGEALARWLPRRRWFQGKAQTITRVEIEDWIELANGVIDVIVEVHYEDAPAERYQIPLAQAVPLPGLDVLRVGGSYRVDAVYRPETCSALAALALTDERVTTHRGRELFGRPVGDPTGEEATGDARHAGELPSSVRHLGAEQSNSSFVFGERVVFKLLRRLEAGVHPDLELTRALTAAGSPHVPSQLGSIALSGEDGPTALGVVSTFVTNAREAWELAVADACAAARSDPAVAGSEFPAYLQALGNAIADIHGTLFRALPARTAGTQDLQDWVERIHSEVDRVWNLLERRPDDTGIRREEVHTALAGFADLIDDPGPLMRIHGDLHLGQAILTPDDRWQFLDFEGEPARTIEQRRLPASPARDIAGMLRSFDYAAAAGLWRAGADPSGGFPPAVSTWRDAVRERFLTGYRASPAAVLREKSADDLVLLFELEKAIYEIGYELANRPDWLPIPLGGMRRMLDQLSDSNQPTPMTGPTMGTPTWHASSADVDALVAGRHTDPHRVLGLHEQEGDTVIRTLRPDAERVEIVRAGGDPVLAERTADGGMFEALIPGKLRAPDYRLRVIRADGHSFELNDPYAVWPTLGDIDLHLVGEGRHQELWRRLGAHVTEIDGVRGTSFALWAPNARAVRVVGEFNDWDGRRNPMRALGSGIWELFLPAVGSGDRYKYEVVSADNRLQLRADPMALWSEVPPANASRVFASSYEWHDDEWLAERAERDHLGGPMSVYEVHLGSWRNVDGRPLTYRELAEQLSDYVELMGFTHVEFLPVAEHPFAASWGYQVTGQFGPTARFGDPDDFRYLVDQLHQRGIGVLVDWVPAHFPRDEWALARFDGTALYEHADPRQAEHPDWGTLVYNFGRYEVRNFLIASALFWLEELHVDGLRVDAVASMLYLDYSREQGEWLPNIYGGNENLEAIEFLKEANTLLYARKPGVISVAEESTAWPGVSRPVHLGGLGFGFKWNMGWMHDTLSYFSRNPIHRRHHHNELTFGLLYAWSENYVLPLSHDEVVHGKRSLLDKMPGDRWQKFANLRALLAYMWAHPGKQLLFMGGEFGQWREWTESSALDWELLDEPDHQGLQQLVRDLNHIYRALPALWQRDHEPEGFQWIDANNADANIVSFARYAEDGSPLVCMANLSPVPREDQRFGLPRHGRWREIVNTDAVGYAGSNIGNLGMVEAEDRPWHGMHASARVVLPPLATLWFIPED